MKDYKNICIKTMLLATLLVSMAIPTSAYVYNGYYWHQGYAHYSIDSTVPSGWTTSIASGASAWNNAGTSFYFYTLGGSNYLYYKSLSPLSTLATTTTTYSGNSISACTTTFNSNDPWSTTGALGYYDVQSVATHEFGHWLSLGHSSNSAAVMYPTISSGVKKRTLNSDDTSGIQYIY